MSRIPDAQGSEIIEAPEWASCECGGDVVIRVWGMGIDSEVWCSNGDCSNKEIYR